MRCTTTVSSCSGNSQPYPVEALEDENNALLGNLSRCAGSSEHLREVKPS
jgi:hypothetical protein